MVGTGASSAHGTHFMQCICALAFAGYLGLKVSGELGGGDYNHAVVGKWTRRYGLNGWWWVVW